MNTFSIPQIVNFVTKDTDIVFEKKDWCGKIGVNSEEKNERERDDTMAAIPKPGAFVISSGKVSEFFARKSNTSSDALKRFEKRKPKDGIVTPFKR